MSRGPESLLTGIVGELPFVDREEELALLRRLFEESVAGRGQVVFIAGEGGIGKTRLVQELGSYAQSKGAVFATGRSYEEDVLVPYSPWIEAIRTIVQSSTEIIGKTLGQTVAEVGRLVPELAVRAKELGIKGWVSGPEMGVLSSIADAERVRLFQAVTDFLNYTSRERPLVLFLDDVLWADAVSLQLLHYFCRRIREHKVMVVATYRDVELPEDHRISRLLLDLNRERLLKKVPLNRLSTDYVAHIISNQLGGGSVSPEFTTLIYSRTGGNPFFVEEVLRSLIEERRVRRSKEGWTLREIERVEIPSTVRALIKQRVSRLGNDVVQTLSVGAVMGMSFSYELLKTVTGYDEELLINQLEKAVRAGLLGERRVGNEVSYFLADEQIRDFLYKELSVIRQRRIHARIANAMEQLYTNEKDRHVQELAHHYIQAGELRKAAEFSLMAGDSATRLHAHAEAKKHYRNVLDLLDQPQQNERLEALIKIADASFRMAEFEECVRYYKEAILLAEHFEQNRRIAQLYRKLGYAHWFLGDNQAALEMYKGGLRAIQSETDTPEEAAISQEIARLLANTGQSKEALEWCEKAIQIARKTDDHEVMAHALQTLSLGLKPTQDNKSEILGYLEEALKISMDHGLEDQACRAYENLAQIYYYYIKSDYNETKNAFMKGLEYARKIGYPNYITILQAEAALYAHIPLGEWDRALEVASSSLRIGSDLGWVHTSYPLVALALASLFKGNIDGAEEYLTRATPLAEKAQWREITYCCYLALGKLYIKKDNPDKAEQFLLRGIEAGSQAGWTLPFEAYFELVKVYCMRPDLEKAHEFYERIRIGAEELDENWAYAYERWTHGLLASVRKNWNEAKEAFKKSSELWNDLKHRYNHAQTMVDFGRALLGKGDREEGMAQIKAARGTFMQLGANLDLAKLESEFQVASYR